MTIRASSAARRALLIALVAGLGAGATSAPASVKAKAKAKAAAHKPPSIIHRTVIHTEAYKKREYLGPHVNIKITPPEKRGSKNHVLVEVYNFSKTYLNVVDFFLFLSNKWGDQIEVHITVDDLKPGWSALRWVEIPGAKKLPEITKVDIKNLKTFNEKGKTVQLKLYTDLIKE